MRYHSGTRHPGRRPRSLRLLVLGSALALLASLGVQGTSLASTAPSVVSFSAAVTAEPNRVTLSWETEGAAASRGVYIYGYRNVLRPDIGYVAPAGTVSVPVPPGTYTWTLSVTDGLGQQVLERRTLTVPGPTPVTVSGSQLVWQEWHDIQDVTIDWNPHGADSTTVFRPDGTSISTTGTSYTATAAELAARGEGLHTFKLQPCQTVPVGNFCGESSIVQVQIGGSRFNGDLREFLPSSPASDVTVSWTSDTGNHWVLAAPTLGIAAMVTNGVPEYRIPKERFTDGVHNLTLTSCRLGQPSCATTLASKQYVVSGTTWTSKSWTEDYDPNQSRAIQGRALDVDIDDAGNIFSIGEFSDHLVSVPSGATEASALQMPLHRVDDPNTNLQARVRPFAVPMFGGVRSTHSAYGERVIRVGQYVYATQGGWETAVGNPPLPNHSRIVRYDTQGADDPNTLTDDRFCMYNMPENNNTVIGITWDGTRIWYLEQRVESRQSVLGSFNPNELPCENFLNYEDEQAVADSAHQYCTSWPATACIRKITLPPSFSGPSHIVYDAEADAVWIAGWWTNGLGRFDIATSSFQQYPSPRASTNTLGVTFPWQIRESGDYVYFGEYGDGDLVRFDKTKPRELCLVLDAKGNNPCMSEIHVPLKVGGGIHSIEIHDNRLYFTVDQWGTIDDGDVFGYVTLDDWASGVRYTGLQSLLEPARAHVDEIGTSGIGINAGGTVALGTVGASNSHQQAILKFVPTSRDDACLRSACSRRRAR